MSDPTGELAERLHLQRLAQLFLEPPPLRHVAGADDHPPRPSVARRDRRRDGFDRAAFLKTLVGIGAALAQAGPDVAIDLGGRLRAQNLIRAAPEDLRARLAVERERRRIDLLEAEAVAVLDKHRVTLGRVLEERRH